MTEEAKVVAANSEATKMTDDGEGDVKASWKGGRRMWWYPIRMRGGRPKHMRRALSQFLVVFLVLAGLTALILWLVYRPAHRPKFSVVSAAVYDLNTTSPGGSGTFISATMQFTVVTRNPNERVSISYDRLSAFVSYQNQMITTPLMLPPLHQAKDSTVSMSPVLGGVPVPVPLELANGLLMDMEAYGILRLTLVLQGRLRWKAGPINTAHYDMYVTCHLFLPFKNGVTGQVPLLGSSSSAADHDDHNCKVDI